MDIVQILILLFFLFFGVSSQTSEPSSVPPVDVSPSGARVATVVERVETLVLESFPPQVQLNVFGYQIDGCDFPVQVEQRRDGTTISVEIFRVVPADVMCPMNIPPYEGTIMLEGPFEVNTAYTVIVNGVTVEVNL